MVRDKNRVSYITTHFLFLDMEFVELKITLGSEFLQFSEDAGNRHRLKSKCGSRVTTGTQRVT